MRSREERAYYEWSRDKKELGWLQEVMESAVAGGARGEEEARGLGFIHDVVGSYEAF